MKKRIFKFLLLAVSIVTFLGNWKMEAVAEEDYRYYPELEARKIISKKVFFDSLPDWKELERSDIEDLVMLAIPDDGIDVSVRWEEPIKVALVDTHLLPKSITPEVDNKLYQAFHLLTSVQDVYFANKNQNVFIIFSNNIYVDANGKFRDLFLRAIPDKNEAILEEVISYYEKNKSPLVCYTGANKNKGIGMVVCIIDAGLPSGDISNVILQSAMKIAGFYGTSTNPKSALYIESRKTEPSLIDFQYLNLHYHPNMNTGLTQEEYKSLALSLFEKIQ